jgi:hypothetical protein
LLLRANNLSIFQSANIFSVQNKIKIHEGRLLSSYAENILLVAYKGICEGEKNNLKSTEKR